MRKLIAILVAPLLVSACQSFGYGSAKVTPDPLSDLIPVAAAYSQPTPANLPQVNWVSELNDPVLPGLVREAISNNTDIAAARASFDAAMARADIAHAGRRPSVNATAGVGRSEYGNDLINDTGSFSAGVGASWEIDLWGRLKDISKASELDAEAAQADLAAARLAITGRVASGWYDLIEARLLSELSDRDVQTQERALRLTERRFEGGLAQSSDVRLARSSVAASQALKATRELRRSAISRSLEVLLRRYPGERLQALSDLPTLPPISGVGNPMDLLTRRPDILAAERRLHSAGLDVSAARKALYPNLSLSGSLRDSGASLKNIFDIDSFLASIAADLAQPLYDGGRLRANVRQQLAVERQFAENYASTVLNAYLEVENALNAEQRLAEREAALRISLDEARQAETRLERRYSEGLASILELLDAQSRRISAESQLISARKERLENRIQLHIALGGGLYGRET